MITKTTTMLAAFALAAGAALAQPLSGVSICIDPGHGGHDPANDRYVATTGFWESESNWSKANILKPMLEDLGATVILTRDGNDDSDDLSLSAREQVANDNNVDYFHSIHSNAHNQQVNYCLLLFEGTTDNPEFPAAKEMGAIMVEDLYWHNRTTGAYNRGDETFLGFNLGVLNDLTMPGTLSEGSFHDYIPESWRLMNEDYRKLSMWAMTTSFLEYFDAGTLSHGSINGIMRDDSTPPSYYYIPDGQDQLKPINGGTVTLNPGGLVYTVDNKNNGFYVFDELAPGDYTLTYEAPGYDATTSTGTVVANKTDYVDVTMTANGEQPATTIFDDFEAGQGHFTNSPTYSGSTVGLDGSSAIALSTSEAHGGSQSLEVSLVDNAGSSDDWEVRLLSGGGSAAANVEIDKSGYLGFWMKTSSAPTGATVHMVIDDDGSTGERTSELPVQNDGAWHEYKWNLPTTTFTAFAAGDGSLTGTATLDAIWFSAPNTSSAWTLYIDDVFNSVPTTAVDNRDDAPVEYHLAQNFPNPFNPTTTVQFTLPKAGDARVDVYNALGARVATLVDRPLSAGAHEARFEANDLSSGVYFYRLLIDGAPVATKKMTLMK